jgi:hypothetical protein
VVEDTFFAVKNNQEQITHMGMSENGLYYSENDLIHDKPPNLGVPSRDFTWLRKITTVDRYIIYIAVMNSMAVLNS